MLYISHKTRVRRPGIEPGSTAWKATMLTPTPPTHMNLVLRKRPQMSMLGQGVIRANLTRQLEWDCGSSAFCLSHILLIKLRFSHIDPDELRHLRMSEIYSLAISENIQASLGGLEPPTFRLTAERANRLRHRDNWWHAG